MFTATDVANFLSCHHLLTLDRAEARGKLKKPFFPDPGLDLLKELGLRHEQSYLDHLIGAQGLEVAQIPTDVSWAEAVARTTAALRRGVSAIYQATFLHGPWHGRSDFLIRVDKPSALGNWSYEPLETKLARSTKAGALIQLCFYSDLLSQIQEVQPEWMHIVLGRTKSPESHAVGQYIAYFRKIKRDFDASFNGSPNTYPEPTEHCDVCSWYPLCDKRRRTDDHLCLVAGITRNQRKTLATRNVVTVAELAKLDLTPNRRSTESAEQRWCESTNRHVSKWKAGRRGISSTNCWKHPIPLSVLRRCPPHQKATFSSIWKVIRMHPSRDLST